MTINTHLPRQVV